VETPDLSRDGGEYPVIAWDAQDIRALNTICVCVPTDSGYGVAEELEGVVGGLPTVARDRNGDVWVAWWWYGESASWMHSHATATAGTPRIEGAGRHRRVAWTLSEPAPETWWAVLRARGSEGFEPVARVRAGPGLEMSWSDTSPPAGLLRYKIRRESVDTRYLWESEETRWPTRTARPHLRVVASVPVRTSGSVEPGRPWLGDGRLEFTDATPGPVEVRLYDLQGRVVMRERGEAGATGAGAVPFRLRAVSPPPPNGIYLAVLRDASGRMSNAVKIVVLR
jgi:hypothetical protein